MAMAKSSGTNGSKLTIGKKLATAKLNPATAKMANLKAMSPSPKMASMTTGVPASKKQIGNSPVAQSAFGMMQKTKALKAKAVGKVLGKKQGLK